MRSVAVALAVLGIELLVWALTTCPLCWLERKLRPRARRKGRGL